MSLSRHGIDYINDISKYMTDTVKDNMPVELFKSVANSLKMLSDMADVITGFDKMTSDKSIEQEQGAFDVIKGLGKKDTAVIPPLYNKNLSQKQFQLFR